MFNTDTTLCVYYLSLLLCLSYSVRLLLYIVVCLLLYACIYMGYALAVKRDALSHVRLAHVVQEMPGMGKKDFMAWVKVRGLKRAAEPTQFGG